MDFWKKKKVELFYLRLGSPPIVPERVVYIEAQTRTNGAKITVLLKTTNSIPEKGGVYRGSNAH